MYFCTFIMRFVVVYGLYMYSAAMTCYMIIMHVCFWFGDVASISKICSYIRAFYRLIEVGCYIRYQNRVNSEVNSVSGKIGRFDEFDRVKTR
jgi:hypothetical protein